MKQDKNIHRHIAAAKGWLSRAEDSLARENDIQGDLKLMLAQAELQRAQEKNDKKLCVRWFKKLAPGVLASMLALGGIIYAQQAYEHTGLAVEKKHIPASVADNVHGAGMAEQKSAPVSANDEAASEAGAISQGAYASQAAEEADSGSERTSRERSGEAASSQAIQTHDNLKSTTVPEADMQKLMQSAGKVLRE